MDGFNIGNTFEDIVTRILGIIPPVLGALAILIIGNWVVKALAGVAHRALERANFDHMVHGAMGGNMFRRVVQRPSHLVGRIVYWMLFFGVVSMAVSALRWPVLDQIVAGIYSYAPKVIAAFAIFLAASAVSAAVAKFVSTVMGDTPTGKLIAAIVPMFTMTIAIFMILNQLGIATDIVNILFTGLVAALSLGSALAFGLGGRDVAAQMLQQAYESGKEKTAQAKADMQVAKQRTRQQVSKAKRAFQEEA